ncbi:Long-chain-fatty-acid--CoA ligase [Paramagnetospirillum magnetotacticum MS-1]|uniref:Long-chain-fatty-acid--CoA ligase n=1 Tax=Paramagnetospirillum magnetotacticum MS-1 TaxID=272627 RepID=A0A0C2V004_PARME|nr:long-chain fatty acid--CoA ligase [Paramagnetospirillum magnetotacticum]KIL98416.1 Long-chain-fatty-acid--CoA ligase [Paramagnetospirillum magnetotacticum MS-1]
MEVEFATQTSLPAMFLEQAARLGERPFLGKKSGGVWHALSWRETEARVLALAAGLRALGLAPGDRVMLVAENRPEWAMADLAIMAAGGISVPAYTTNTVADHRHILDNCGARLVIVSTRALAERILPAAAHSDQAPAIIAMEPLALAQSPGVDIHSWEAVLELGRGAEAPIRTIIAGLKRDDTACLIYTSGTGGVPKGVMLSHGAILCNCMGATDVLRELGLENEVFLSFLPLSHAYEHTAGLYFPISIGAEIRYAEGLEHLATNMAEVSPSIMTAVPRLYESMRTRILKGLARVSPLRRRLFMAALDLGTRRIKGERLGLLEILADLVLERLVRHKVRDRFGGKLKAFVSGGAPLPYEVGVFFMALGVRILQGYGQTEAAPVIAVNRPDRNRIETVGPPMLGVEIRIASDGEILVRGEMVMQGYWRDAHSTAQAVDSEGWLHTGDIGEIDPDGALRITDRKKDIIVNSGGDNIAPQRIESFLTLEPEIAQAMVHGDRKPHLVALIVPDPEWRQSMGLADPESEDTLQKTLGRVVDRVNRQLSAIEKIRRFKVIDDPFSVENGMLTPTLKIRRHQIRIIHGESLNQLYEDKSTPQQHPFNEIHDNR